MKWLKDLVARLNKYLNPPQPINVKDNGFSFINYNTKDTFAVVQGARSVEEFIRALDQMVPHCHPHESMTDRQIWTKVGERNLVERLNSVLDQLENQKD